MVTSTEEGMGMKDTNTEDHNTYYFCKKCGKPMSEREWTGRFLTGYVCPACHSKGREAE